MRRHYLDSIRSITILLVVLYHTLYMFTAIPGMYVVGSFSEVQGQDAIMYLLYPWFMVLLFIVSGMSSRYYLEKHMSVEYRKSRILKLLVPSTIGVVLFGWIQGIINLTLGGVFETMPSDMPKAFLALIVIFSGTGVLWFAQVLWLYSMILLLIVKREKGTFYAKTERTGMWVILLLGIPFYLSSQVLNTPIIAVYRFGIYAFAFFSGYFLFAHDAVIEKLATYRWYLTAASLLFGILYTVTSFGQNYALAPAVNSPLAMAFSWFACLSILGLGKQYLDTTTPALDYLKRKNWGIYIFHYLPASAMAMVLYKTSIPPLIQYLLVTIASLAGSILLYEVISRIPLLRWCILGIKKK